MGIRKLCVGQAIDQCGKLMREERILRWTMGILGVYQWRLESGEADLTKWM